MAVFYQQIEVQGVNAPGVPELMKALNKLADAMTAYSQTEAAQKALDKAAKD